jgi:primosomal protein N'
MHKCAKCARIFKNAAGLSSHTRSCKISKNAKNSKTKSPVMLPAAVMERISQEAEHQAYNISPIKLNASLINQDYSEDVYESEEFEIENRPLKPCSEEQLAVVQTIKTHNVSIDAVAGSGKTTTCLHICKEYNKKNILIKTIISLHGF